MNRHDPYLEAAPREHYPYAQSVTGVEGYKTPFKSHSLSKIIDMLDVDVVLHLGPGLGHDTIQIANYLTQHSDVQKNIITVGTWLGTSDDWIGGGNKLLPYMHPNLGFMPLLRRFLDNMKFNNLDELVIPCPLTIQMFANLVRAYNVKFPIIILSDHADLGSTLEDVFHFVFQHITFDGVLVLPIRYKSHVNNYTSNYALNDQCIVKDDLIYIFKSRIFYLVLSDCIYNKNSINSLEKVHYENVKLSSYLSKNVVAPKLVPLSSIHTWPSEDTCHVKITNEISLESKDYSLNGYCSDKVKKFEPIITGNIEHFKGVNASLNRNVIFIPNNIIGESQIACTFDGQLIMGNDASLVSFYQNGIIQHLADGDGARLDTTLNITYCEPPVIFIGGTRNNYHWHADYLSLIFHVELVTKQLGIDKYKIAVTDISSHALESLKLLGYEGDDIIDLSATALVAKKFLHFKTGPKDSLSPLSSVLFNRIVENAVATEIANRNNINTPELIYVTRDDSKRRRITNENDLLQKLIPLGFEVVRAADIAYTQKIALFSQAKFIISPHGAGIANSLFSQEGCNLLEIFRPGPANNLNTRLAISKSHKYNYMILDTPLGAHQDFEVPVDLIIKKTKDILNSI